jgi:hypothetical protein
MPAIHVREHPARVMSGLQLGEAARRLVTNSLNVRGSGNTSAPSMPYHSIMNDMHQVNVVHHMGNQSMAPPVEPHGSCPGRMNPTLLPQQRQLSVTAASSSPATNSTATTGRTASHPHDFRGRALKKGRRGGRTASRPNESHPPVEQSAGQPGWYVPRGNVPNGQVPAYASHYQGNRGSQQSHPYRMRDSAPPIYGYQQTAGDLYSSQPHLPLGPGRYGQSPSTYPGVRAGGYQPPPCGGIRQWHQQPYNSYAGRGPYGGADSRLQQPHNHHGGLGRKSKQRRRK